MSVKRIKLRGGTMAQWSVANPTLASREMAVETDTYRFKIGDGSTPWNSLPYSDTLGVIPISDSSFSSGWDGVGAIAPSKNAIYDKIIAMISDTVFGAGWSGVTDIAPSKGAIYNAIVNMGSKRSNKINTDSPYTVTVADLGGLTIFTNTGTVSEVVFNLPAGSDGYMFNGIVTTTQYMRFVANGSETIRYLATVSAGGGYVRSNVIGNTIQGIWSGAQWVIFGIGGAWTYDS